MAEKQTNKERLKDITDSIERGIQEERETVFHFISTILSPSVAKFLKKDKLFFAGTSNAEIIRIDYPNDFCACA